MRRWLLIALSFGGSAFFLWLVLRDVPLAEVVMGIQQADGFWLLLAFAMSVVTMWTRAVRWRGLLENRLPMRDAFLLLSIAMMLNQLPLRAGEFARSALVTRYNVPFFTSITSIIIERILDLLAVVLVIAFTLPFVPGAGAEVGRAAWTLGGLALLGFMLLLFFARRPDIPHSILNWLNKRLPFLQRVPLGGLLDNVLQGIRPLLDPRRLAHVLFWTAMAWLTSFIALYLLTRALAVPAELQVLVTLLGVGLTALWLALPLSVASLGPFQAAMAFTGQLVGLDPVLAVTLGFLFNGTAVITYVVAGTIGLLVLGLSLGNLFGAKATPPIPVSES